MTNVFGKTTSFVAAVVLALAASAANAVPITFGFSGKVDWNFIDVPVGTVLYGSVTYDSDAAYEQISPYRYGYRIDNMILTIGGETATNSTGSITIDNDRLSFYVGPAIYLGGGADFSSTINGINVRGISFTLYDLPVADVLPDDPAVVYGLTPGTFGINRAGGDLYDVNSVANLRIPPGHQALAVPEPATIWLLIIGVGGLLLLGNRRNCHFVRTAWQGV